MTRAIEGDPIDIARFAHRSIQAREYGVLFAVVMDGTRRAQIVASDSKRYAALEKSDPSRVVGHYVAARNLARNGVTVESIAADIEETLR